MIASSTRAALIGAALLIGGCASQAKDAATTSSPSPAATISGAACGPEEARISAIPMEDVNEGGALPSAATKSIVRIVVRPGPEREECAGTTGVVMGKAGGTVVVAVAGPAAEAKEFWIGGIRAGVLGRSPEPAIAILEAQCEAYCADEIGARTAESVAATPILIGNTDGSILPLGHPARAADGPEDFGGTGPLETWVYSLVGDAAESGDGVWNPDGRLVGLAYADFKDAGHPLVHRILYVPASDVLTAANLLIRKANAK